MPKRSRKSRLTPKQLASDDALREKLRTADLKKFDRALAKAIRPH